MRVIQVAKGAKGARYPAALDKARAHVKQDELYFIRRHGAFFRDAAHGYTTEISGAGMFLGRDAAGYLSADGVSLTPIRDYEAIIVGSLMETTKAASRLAGFVALIASEKAGK